MNDDLNELLGASVIHALNSAKKGETLQVQAKTKNCFLSLALTFQKNKEQ